MKQKNGFTLAEVLITIVVIGIIAAIIIPVILQNHKEKVTVTKVKRAYKTLFDAYQFAQIELGTPDNWGIEGRTLENAIIVRDILLKNIRVNKVFDTAEEAWEWYGTNNNIRYLNGQDGFSFSPIALVVYAVLEDGSLFLICSNNPDDNRGAGQLGRAYANIGIDINGSAPPNTEGIDVFYFYLTELGVLPAGSQYDTSYPFDKDCTPTGRGVGCTAWVIENGNMDYLHCNDLSWSGKRTCK